MSKQAILDALHDARAQVLATLEGLDEEAMLRTGASGTWSVKDVLAHITAWESELVTALNQAQGRGVPRIVQIDDIDAWNEEQHHINVRRPLQRVMSDFEGVHAKLLAMVGDLSEEFLSDTRRFDWLEGESLAYLIEENAWGHELEHLEDLRAWRESQS